MLVFSLICAVIQIILWWLYEYDVLKNFFTKIVSENFGKQINKITKCLIDILPCILIIKFNSHLALFFLLGCLISDKFISISTPLGAIMFMLVYSFVSVITIKNYVPINYKYMILAYFNILVMCFIILPIWKESILLKFASVVYGFTALALCIWAFFCTKNIGFLSLMIGDILLTVREILKDSKYEKLIHSISNSFYFIGVCFVPLSLI